MAETACPKCNARFAASKNRSYRGIKTDFIQRLHGGDTAPERWVDESSFMRRPSCGMQFKSEAVRFFGILSPKGLKIFIGLFVLAFLCIVLYILFISVKEFWI
jgi:uncharacterized C2H2 Zn-finger protein